MSPLPDRGPLDGSALPRLLLELFRERYDGALRLQRERISKRITFSEGAPVSVESSREADGLLALLHARGRLDDERLAKVRQHVARRRTSEPGALAELGLLGPRELLAALREQTRAALLDCFAWASGQFELERGAAPPANAAPLRGDLLQWIREGLEAHHGPERLFADLSPRLGRYPELREAPRMVRWIEKDEAGRSLLASLDGRTTLDQAMRASASPRSLALAWLLDAFQALAFHESPLPEEEKEEPSADESADESEVEEALEIVIESNQAARAGSAAAATGPAASAHSRSERPGRDAQALRHEVVEKYERLDELDHYELLGLTKDASAADIKRAYFSAAKRFHPDALTRLGLTDLKSEANQVFARIAKAHQTLSDPQARRNYDASRDGEELDGTRLVQAEMLYRKAEILLRAGNFRGALEFLRPAVELWPMEALYQASLGWALHRAGPPDHEAAREHLTRALSLDPQLAQAHLWLGSVLKQLGENAEASAAFARARQLDPKLA